MRCECCCEREVWSEAQSHGYELCEECASHDRLCDECGKAVADEHLTWLSATCDDCRAKIARHDWEDETTAAVESLCRELGWTVADTQYSASTYSQYLTLSHDEGDRQVKVRISDHQTCYASEDYSIDPDELDGSIEGLRKLLVSKK